MPATRNSRSRSCKDMSVNTKTQINIEFPQRKRSTVKKSISKAEVGEKSVDSSPVKKIYPKRKSASVTCTDLDDDNIENVCSPIKSPRKMPEKSKPPLVDVTNKVSNGCSPIKRCPTPARKIILSQACDDSKYTSLCRVLHNSIPEDLISRKTELEVLRKFVDSCVLQSKPGSMYICGAPGTGKTACLTKVLEGSKEMKVKTIFLNCMSLRQSQSIFARLASLLDNSGKIFSNQDGMKFLEKKLTANGQRILLVLDEIDQLESKDQEVLYKLFELPFLPRSRLVLIGIANSLDFTDRVLPRLETRTLCKPILLQFQPYKRDEITAILQARIKETYSEIVDPSAIQFCARKVSAMTGDARKALDILRRAVEIAESQSKKANKDSQINKVNIGHVASVCSDVYGARMVPTSNTTFVFPLQQKIIICTLVACLKQSKIKEVTSSKYYQKYCQVSNGKHLTPISQEEFNGVCDLLESQGIITVKKTKNAYSNKISLRMQESELEHALQDKSLMQSILSDKL